MKNKYIIPKIEDIKIGYKCEVYIPGSGDNYKETEVNENNILFFMNIFASHLQKGWLRKAIVESVKSSEEKEIEDLIKEADSRGFKKGTVYKRTVSLPNGEIITQEECAEHRAEHFHTYTDERGIALYCGNGQGCIYISGKWVEIIK
jgi:hypothetical protein